MCQMCLIAQIYFIVYSLHILTYSSTLARSHRALWQATLSPTVNCWVPRRRIKFEVGQLLPPQPSDSASLCVQQRVSKFWVFFVIRKDIGVKQRENKNSRHAEKMSVCVCVCVCACTRVRAVSLATPKAIDQHLQPSGMFVIQG